MKIGSIAAIAIFTLMLLLSQGVTAEAAELKILCANGMQTVMEDLGPKFERATGLVTNHIPFELSRILKLFNFSLDERKHYEL